MRVLLVAVLVAAVGVVPVAVAKDVDKGPRFTAVEKQYLKLYPQARKAFGYRTVGRNVVRTGMTNRRVATQSEIRASVARMDSWLHPTPVAAPTAPSNSNGGSVGYSGGVPAELEQIAQCESGGDYGAVNPSSGAYGKYQILPSTSAAHGCDMATPAGQDACAVEIYAGGAGRSQWVC